MIDRSYAESTIIAQVKKKEKNNVIASKIIK